MRIWCEGCEIGDFEDPFCGLYTSYMGFHALRDRLSSLWLDEFEGLSDQELWNLLDGALYGYHATSRWRTSARLKKCKGIPRDMSRSTF